MNAPALIAHRGYAYRYPENTLPALDAAVRAGARYVEFDTQLSADRVPVLLHDPTLTRTTARPGSVHDLTWDDLKHLSAHEPQRFGNRFQGVTIPRLADACRLVSNAPGVTAFVELKEESIDAFGPEPAARAVLDVTRAEPDPTRFVLISYDLPALQAARHLGPTAVGWVLHTWDDASRRAAQTLRPDYLFCNKTKVPDTDQPFWPGPWRWAVYEITDAHEAHAWAARGADMVETFRIGDVLADPTRAGGRGARAEL